MGTKEENEKRTGIYKRCEIFYNSLSGFTGQSTLTYLLENINYLIKDCVAAGHIEFCVRSLVLYSKTLRKLGKTESALKFAIKASNLAKDNGLIYESIFAENGCAFLYLQLFELEQGKTIAFQSLSDARKQGFADLEADTLALVGHIFELEENFNKAIAYFFKALQTAKSAQDVEREVAALSDLGRILGMQGDFIKSLDYLEKGLEIADEKCVAKYMPVINYQIADVYRSLDDIALANKHLDDSLLFANALNYSEAIVEIQSRIGKLRLHESKYEEALECFKTIDSQTAKMKYIRDNRLNSVAIAETLIGMKSYSKAREVLVQLLKKVQSQPASNHILICQILEQLSIVYSHQGYPLESKHLTEYSRRFKDSQKFGMYNSHQQKLARQSLYSKFENDISEIIDKEIKEFEVRGRTIKFVQETAFVTFADSDEEAELTLTESKYLRCLKIKQGTPVSVIRLAQEVYPSADDDSPKDWRPTVKTHIMNIRKKLKDEKGGSIIKQVRNKGYMLSKS